MKVGIIGLGLIGGSIALALKKHAGVTDIVAISPREETLREAIAHGVITKGSVDDYTLLDDCDLIFICTPVSKIGPIMERIKGDCIMTDVGSTKAEIADMAERMGKARFIPAHPMAGSEKRGFKAASADLFENAPYLICPTALNRREDVQVLENLILAMQAKPVILSAKEHDRMIGIVSHLPHVASAALVAMAANSHDDRLVHLAAGGFKDITRISSSDPDMWTDISRSNQALGELIDEYIALLRGFRDQLGAEDRDSMRGFFAASKDYRGRLTDRKNVQIWIDIMDRPGSLADIVNLFSREKINIRDIYIQDSREYEGGSLRITLSRAQDAVQAEEMLLREGLEFKIMN